MGDTPKATEKPKETTDKDANKIDSLTGLVIFILIILWLWFIAGALAFLASLVCFGFNGSIGDKFLGLVIVLLLGPFYWLYFIYNSNYCYL